MELPNTDMKTFTGKVKDVLIEMKSCFEHMMENYPFEDSNDRNAPKEMRKVRERQTKRNEELKVAVSKEA